MIGLGDINKGQSSIKLEHCRSENVKLPDSGSLIAGEESNK